MLELLVTLKGSRRRGETKEENTTAHWPNDSSVTLSVVPPWLGLPWMGLKCIIKASETVPKTHKTQKHLRPVYFKSHI